MRKEITKMHIVVTSKERHQARINLNRKIAKENEAFLNRLQGQSSVYNVYDWEHDRKKQVKLVKNICHHEVNKLIGKKTKK